MLKRHTLKRVVNKAPRERGFPREFALAIVRETSIIRIIKGLREDREQMGDDHPLLKPAQAAIAALENYRLKVKTYTDQQSEGYHDEVAASAVAEYREQRKAARLARTK